MNQYAHVVDLINLWAKYESETKEEANVVDFGAWLINNQSKESKLAVITEESPINQIVANEPPPSNYINSQLSNLLKRIYKFDLMYAKKALDKSELNNYEDFSYLATLYEVENPRKSELILMNISEFTSGIEVIKRLVKMGLAEERVDPEDRRSKRIMITAKGREIYQQCLPEMSQISDMLFLNLSSPDKQHLLSLLEPINAIHTSLINQIRDSSLSEAKDIIQELRIV